MQGKVQSESKVRRGHAKQDALAVCCLVFAGRAMPRAPAVARSGVQPSSIVQRILLEHCAVYLTAVLHACGGKWQAPTEKLDTLTGEGADALSATPAAPMQGKVESEMQGKVQSESKVRRGRAKEKLDTPTGEGGRADAPSATPATPPPHGGREPIAGFCGMILSPCARWCAFLPACL